MKRRIKLNIMRYTIYINEYNWALVDNKREYYYGWSKRRGFEKGYQL